MSVQEEPKKEVENKLEKIKNNPSINENSKKFSSNTLNTS
jgi:hypothetical protein